MSNLNVFSKSKQIKILVCVLSAAALSAVLFMFAMLQYYNPSGVYYANNVLLSPKTYFLLKEDSKLKKANEITFDRFEFSFFEGFKQKTITIDEKQYFSFYDLVKNDVSIKNPEEKLERSFIYGKFATLSFIANDKSSERKFKLTEIDILPGDFYRIQLNEPSQKNMSLYFYHPGIYNTAIEQFAGRHEE